MFYSMPSLPPPQTSLEECSAWVFTGWSQLAWPDTVAVEDEVWGDWRVWCCQSWLVLALPGCRLDCRVLAPVSGPQWSSSHLTNYQTQTDHEAAKFFPEISRQSEARGGEVVGPVLR